MPSSTLPRISATLLATSLLALAACSSSPDPSNPGTGGGGGAGGSGGNGGTSCAQAESMLDVSKGPGPGPGYPAPKLSASCTEMTFVVESNSLPTYTFMQTTPNPLQEVDAHYEITRTPQKAAATTKLPLLGIVGFAVNGLGFFGPNEADTPADEAYGDPVYNGLMDPCLGHTANSYHYHSMEEKCLVPSGLVEKPWTNAAPAATEPSPILGWALDGFPILGSRECADAGCAEVVEMKSGYEKIGDPKTNAWDAYAWKDHPGDATYLDECNGHDGPDGSYHYHATKTFPYILGCYQGTPNGAGGGGMMGGPKACTSDAECTGACPQGSIGCKCGDTPMGKLCIPTCTTSADCPAGPMGSLQCKGGVCAP